MLFASEAVRQEIGPGITPVTSPDPAESSKTAAAHPDHHNKRPCQNVVLQKKLRGRHENSAQNVVFIPPVTPGPPRKSSAGSAISSQVFEELWQRATSVQPPLNETWLWVIGAAALLLTWSPVGYRLVRHLATLLHEAGHALVAVLVGRRLSGIRLHSDTSGLTVSRGRPTGPGMVATLLAGYPAPAIVGLGGAWLVSQGYAAGSMWALVVLCALMLLLIRNLYGLWVVLVTGVGVAVLSWTATPQILSIAAYLMVWSLLLVAPRAVVELQRSRRRKRHSTRSDADQLAGLTRVPAGLWIGVFWIVSVACLVGGGWLLLGRA